MLFFRSRSEFEEQTEAARFIFDDLSSKRNALESSLFARKSIEENYVRSLETLSNEIKKIFGNHPLWDHSVSHFYQSLVIKQEQGKALMAELSDLLASKTEVETSKKLDDGVANVFSDFSRIRSETDLMTKKLETFESEIQTLQSGIARLSDPAKIAQDISKLSQKKVELSEFVTRSTATNKLFSERLEIAKNFLRARERRAFESAGERLYAALIIEFSCLRSTEYDLSKVIEQLKAQDQKPKLICQSVLEKIHHPGEKLDKILKAYSESDTCLAAD